MQWAIAYKQVCHTYVSVARKCGTPQEQLHSEPGPERSVASKAGNSTAAGNKQQTQNDKLLIENG
jgi:hypothetical protein